MAESRLPRDAAGSIELVEGTGGLITACSFEDFLEIYKEDTTFRVQTPETIDPERTNPNARMVAVVSDNVGTSNIVVARVLLQARDLLEATPLERPVEKAAVLQCLHECKEALVVCDKVSKRVAAHVDQIVKEIEAKGVLRDRHSGAVNSLPQVPDLDADAATFLIHAKRAIQGVCRLPALFIDLPARDTNFDALAKRLEAAVGDVPLTRFVRDNADVIRYIIDLRNYQEHPSSKRTVVRNFAVNPDGRVSPPGWYVTGTPPADIQGDMVTATRILVEIAEIMMIALVMHAIDKRFPFGIQKISDDQVDPKMPIHYRLALDPSRLRPATSDQGPSA